jgi:hypothetical protein
MVLGMTRDELFDAFSRFVKSRGDVAGAAEPSVELIDASSADAGAAAPSDAVVADRGQPSRVHAKAKAKKKR